MFILIFYSVDGKAAKLRSREVTAVKANFARVYDAAAWDGTPEKCDAVIIMPDVPGWQVNRINSVYGDRIADESAGAMDESGEMPPAGVSQVHVPEGQEKPPVEKMAVHKGGGRWFVMAGDEKISGPHDKAEAKRLAELVEA